MRTIVKSVSLALATLLATTALPACAETPARPAAKPDSDPALWVVRDADTTVYLFGTIHVLKPGLTWFDEAVRAAFDKSDELKLEIVEPEPAAMAGLIQAKGMSLTGPTLTQKLPAKQRPLLAKYMAQVGMPQMAYDRMQPWLATSALQVQALTKVGYDPQSGPEQVLTAAAKQAGKPVTALETAEQQIGFFASLSDKAQIAMLDETLDEMPTLQKSMTQMVDAWSAGKTDVIAKELNEGVTRSPETMRVLLTDRNKRWAEWIANRMARPGTLFIAVGAGHLAGPASVQAELAKRGVRVTRVRY